MVACQPSASSGPGEGALRDPAVAPKVLALIAQGHSYRLVGREVGLGKSTVAAIVLRNRAPASTP